MRFILAIMLTTALAACSQDPGTNTAEPVGRLHDAADVLTNEGTGPAATGPAAPAPSDAIPAAMQGRWGLVPADCTSTLGDNKGLLTIADRQLRFYESRASLDDMVELGPNRLVADFDFSGEGMEWERRVTLELQEGGQVLVRREEGEGATPDSFSYRRCEQ